MDRYSEVSLYKIEGGGTKKQSMSQTNSYIPSSQTNQGEIKLLNANRKLEKQLSDLQSKYDTLLKQHKELSNKYKHLTFQA
tara:strand:- start:115 stop:357 length:243 start_codon:yes stop_codon:yes gene_type:complete